MALIVPTVAAAFLPPEIEPSSVPFGPDPSGDDDANTTLGAAHRVPDLTTIRGAMAAPLQAIERAGLGAAGLAAAWDHGQGSMHWRWSSMTGDLDGDGVPDVLRNDVDLETAQVDAHAISGADGSQLWTFPHGTVLNLVGRPGAPNVRDDGRVQRMPDVNADGVPDVMVLEMAAQTVVANGAVEAYTIPYAVHALDGRTGASIWSHEGMASWTLVRGDPLVLVVDDLPTGWLLHGPRIVLKTTDVVMTVVYDPSCAVTGCILGWNARDAQVSETITTLDDTGRTVWVKEIPASDDPEHTRWTWLTGVTRGPTGPQLVLDVLLETRPQASEPLEGPTDGEPMAHYGRGMVVRALDWRAGGDVWQTLVFDEAAWRVRVPESEEPYPVLAWTHATILPDMDGDGFEDPVASYLVREVSDPGATNGQWRTHFVPLSGADGVELLRYTSRGWGYAAGLGVPGWFATGTVDLPADPAPGGGYPDQFVQLAAIDAVTGPVWSREEPFVQASGISYDMALLQLHGAITMPDLDGDGMREVISPPQYLRPSGQNQTLASNAHHRYAVHSGASGDVLYQVDAWGRAGFIVPCPLEDTSLVFLTGHGRRVEATRIDIPTAAALWQHTMVFDERPRPATAPVNIVLWGGACDHLDGVTTVSNNLLTSFLGPVGTLTFEAPSAAAAVHADGTGWVDPASTDAPTDVLFVVRQSIPEPLWSLQNIILLGGSVAGGVLGGAIVVWTRRPKRPDDGLGKDPLGLGWRVR